MSLPDYDPQYAPYIWAVYALAGLTITAMISLTLLRASRAKKALDALKREADA